MALLGIPILLGMHHIYEWTDAAHVAADPMLVQKQPYLNIPFFVARYALYFVIWTGLAYTLSGWSRSQDTNYEPGSERKFRLLSGPGLLLLRGRLDLRRRRLDDVARPALVLDHLRAAVPDPAGAGGDRLRAAADGLDVEDAADVAHRPPRRHPRLRQVPAHLRDGLGLLLVLAVPDHLVGEPARGDSLVPRADAATAGSGSASCCWSASSSCRSSCCCRAT